MDRYRRQGMEYRYEDDSREIGRITRPVPEADPAKAGDDEPGAVADEQSGQDQGEETPS